MRGEGDTLVIDIGAAPEQSDKRAATVWLAIAKEVEKVAVARGENRGRELTYHHPVRELTPIGMWHGEAMTLRLPLKDLKTMGGDCLFALLQVENAGPDPRRRGVRAVGEHAASATRPLSSVVPDWTPRATQNGPENRPVAASTGGSDHWKEMSQ